MKTRPLLLLVLLLLPLAARAHIGSPNVFFEVHAGPHAVRVIIRPPGALPGLAQIDVRVPGDDIQAVTVHPRFRDAEAPAAVIAQPVSGDASLFSTTFWLLRRGTYAVEVAVESASGQGVVTVPLQAAAFVRPEMPPALEATLILLGVLLFAGAVWIAVVLAPARPRFAGVGATLILAASVALGATRWQRMDREFRNNALARPVPVDAAIRTAGPLRLLRVTPLADAVSGWDSLVTDHGKLMHLFLCREPAFDAFAHLHPVRRDAATFENVLPPLPAGRYQLYAEITAATGQSETLAASVELPAPTGPALPPQGDWKMVNEVWCQSPSVPRENGAPPLALDADDAWHLAPMPPAAAERTQVAPLIEGSRMVFENAGDLVENRDTTLRFSVFTADGRRAALQPYMGMRGHAIIRRVDGSVFTHLHPAGTISMAAQELLQERAGLPPPAPVESSADEAIAFPYAFPQPGEYHVWTQVRMGGRVLTGAFTVRVKTAR